jgi:outer membrane protein OmpA-like peptidoglycan-associated protein
MPNEPGKKKTRINRIKWINKIGLILAGLFLLYVIVGFWVVPPLLKPKLEEQLSSLLGRKVTIAEIKLNPLVLSATTSDLTVHEIDGQPFAGFEELYANAQLSSIIKWAFTVREIRVQVPFGVLKLLPDNKLNIDDILAKLSEPRQEPKETAGLPRAVIEKFQVIDGKVALENLAGKEPFRTEVTPISFSLENLSTLKGREGEYLFEGTGSSGDHFEVKGRLAVNPVRVKGSCSITDTQISHYWELLKDVVSFQIINGTTDVSGDYTVEIIDGQLNAWLENGTFKIEDFELVEKGKKEVLIALPSLSVQGIVADLQAQEINVELIQTVDGRIKSWLSADGVFDFQRLFLPDLEKLMKKNESEEPESEPVPAPPWHVALKKMEVSNWGLDFEDRTLSNSAKLSVDDIDVVVENLTNKKDTSATVGIAMQLNKAGNVKINGTAGIDPFLADLNVVTEKIALKSFQPYVDDAVNARIAAGSTSSQGRIRYRGQDAQPQIQYEGDFSVDDVKIQGRVLTEDFITLVHLKTRGIGLDLRPNKLNVSQVLIDRPHAMVSVDQAGVVNVLNAFTPVEKVKQKEGKKNLLQRLVKFLILQFKGPMPMNVDRVHLKTLTGDFLDDSISPTYGTHVEITEATATGLSSDPSARANFKLNGRIDETATIEGTGQMNPMSALQHSKVYVSLKDFELKPLSPYSGKFIGFKINQGTLHTDLKYSVSDNTVDGDNIIVIDQLELGEKVDSPNALNLPIKLGVTLLKDSNGRIKVQVPVKGNVKDPKFDFNKALQSGLTRTIKDAGSAPFAAITEIDGFTGEELQVVAFDFGFSELQDREIQKLNALAKFLKEKDTLKLSIVGTADRQMDGAAIMGEPPSKTPSLDASASENKSLAEPAAAPVVNAVRLEQLAQRRADKVSAYLVEQAAINAKRIQVNPVQIKPKPNGEQGLVEFSLSVK